jgi:cysteine desulfuration protein SufE
VHGGTVPSLEAKLADLTAVFANLTDPQERLAFAAEGGRRASALRPEERTEVNRVRACVSPVWLVGESREGKCYFRAEAESPVVQGLLALLSDFYSEARAEEIAATNVDPLEALGLLRDLSPTRRNGLAGARALIQAYARSQLNQSRPS